jgi:hypothetical protein
MSLETLSNMNAKASYVPCQDCAEVTQRCERDFMS